MNTKDISEYNRRCAEFLGWEYIDKEAHESAYQNYGWWIKGTYHNEIDALHNPNWKGFNSDSYLKFDSDWNQIHRIIDEIKKLGTCFIVHNRWNEFHSYSYTQVTVSVSKGEMSKDRKCIHNSIMLYEKHSDSVQNEKESVVQAINQFLIWYKLRNSII